MNTATIVSLISTPLLAADVSFYVGTYTKGPGSEGIYHGTLNTQTGEATSIDMPTYSPRQKYVTFFVQSLGAPRG